MSKSLIFEDKARQALADGVSKIARAVAVTMGPKGRNVVLEKDYGTPVIINDGVSIAREIDLKDPYENLGAQLVKEVANNTNDAAGDGTTTATVLVNKILHAGLRHIKAGVSAVEIKRGMDEAVKVVVKHLKDTSVEIKDRKEIEQVATISANNDEYIGSLIADAMSKVGKEGVVTIEESKGTETTVETTDGMQFDQGYIAPHFATRKETMEAIQEDALILVSEDKMESVQEVIEFLTVVAESVKKPVTIIADSFSNDVMTLLVVNFLKGAINVVAVKAPGFGDNRKSMLEDIAIMTGATKISSTTGNPLSDFKIEMLGTARRVAVTKDHTTITEGGGSKEALAERISQLKSQKDATESDYDKGRIQERISKMSGGIAVLSIGASSETELNEKKLRVEDALNATRAAVEEGIVAGGGVALARCRQMLLSRLDEFDGDKRTGAEIIAGALTAPLAQIASNAGVNGEIAVERVERGEGSFGYNAANGEYEDMIKAGVIDPTKVTRSALQNAASVAGMMLTTECIVIKDREEKDK